MTLYRLMLDLQNNNHNNNLIKNYLCKQIKQYPKQAQYKQNTNSILFDSNYTCNIYAYARHDIKK